MTKINWKLRLQNKATLTGIVLQIISIVYMILAIFDIAPSVNQNAVIGIAEAVIGLLVLIGVVIDPTTQGLNDSEAAMTYEQPKEAILDEEEED